MRFSTLSYLSAAVLMMTADGAKSGKVNEPAPPKPDAKPDGVEAKVNEAAGTAIAARTVFDASAPTALINGHKFKVKQITRNVFPQKPGQTLAVRVTGKIFQGEKLKNATGEQKNMDAPKMFEGVNLETGEIGLVIANTVLEGEFDKSYPNGAYVGKSFAITMKDVPGKRYKQFVVFELEPEDAAA